MSMHCTARMTDSERLSRPPATTSYPATYYPLGGERLFTRQLQPQKKRRKGALNLPIILSLPPNADPTPNLTLFLTLTLTTNPDSDHDP